MMARVLAQNPKIILLDEPTAHLDFVNSHRLLQIVKGLAESGYTVIAVLHDPNQAFLYGDEFVFLKNGEIFIPEKGQYLWDPAVMKSVYEADVDCIVHDNRPFIFPKAKK